MRIALVGPDGAGKSAVAASLSEALTTTGQPCLLLHYNRPISPVDRAAFPHARRPRRAVICHLKLLVLFPSFWLQAKRLGQQNHYVLEQRIWYDHVVDPLRYRLTPSAGRLAYFLARFLPRADVAVLLRGDPVIIAARKGELTPEETARQLSQWEQLIGICAHRWVTIDTTATTPSDCVAAALAFFARKSAE
jgi:hypothetical protein